MTYEYMTGMGTIGPLVPAGSMNTGAWSSLVPPTLNIGHPTGLPSTVTSLFSPAPPCATIVEQRGGQRVPVGVPEQVDPANRTEALQKGCTCHSTRSGVLDCCCPPEAPQGMRNEWLRPPTPPSRESPVTWEAGQRARGCQETNISRGFMDEYRALWQCPAQPSAVHPVPGVVPAPRQIPSHLTEARQLPGQRRGLHWIWLVAAAAGAGALVWFWKR